jgi:hypothetical protein
MLLHEPFPFEPDEDITELETDVGEAGLLVCCGDVLKELECETGDITGFNPTDIPAVVGTGALYVQTIRSCPEL